MDVERQVYIQAEFAMVKGVFEGHWNALLPTEMYGVDDSSGTNPRTWPNFGPRDRMAPQPGPSGSNGVGKAPW